MKRKYYDPGSPEEKEIIARQKARFKKLDEEAAPRHAAAIALYGVDAAARKAAENGTSLRIQNPWTGEGQSYEEYQAYLAQQAGNAAAGNVVEVDFTPNFGKVVTDEANSPNAA